MNHFGGPCARHGAIKYSFPRQQQTEMASDDEHIFTRLSQPPTSPPDRAPLLRRNEASEYLRSRWGLNRATATLAKLACVGGGPCRFEKAGRWPLYSILWTLMPGRVDLLGEISHFARLLRRPEPCPTHANAALAGAALRIDSRGWRNPQI